MKTTLEEAKASFVEIVKKVWNEPVYEDDVKNWNLRDYVSEVKFITAEMIDSMYNCGEVTNESVKNLVECFVFINRYKEKAMAMKCNEIHCSEYDF